MKSLILALGLIATGHTTAIPETLQLDLHLGLGLGVEKFSKDGYYITFFDSFTGQPGTLPSEKNWIFDLGTSYPGGPERWGNNEFETYTDDTSNIHLTSDSTLAIIPWHTVTGWTSARIETQRSDFAAKEGGKLYVEAKIKLGNASVVDQQGIWPAFWALGSTFRGNYTNWPEPSEWDFMEVINGLPTMYSTLHCGFAPGGPCNEYNGVGNGGKPFAKGVWHTIGFEVDRSMCGGEQDGTWEEETLNWYLDGESVFVVNGSTIGDKEAWKKLAHDEHFLLLNLAVGGNWPGAPNNRTIDGPTVGMEVGHVGAWYSI